MAAKGQERTSPPCAPMSAMCQERHFAPQQTRPPFTRAQPAMSALLPQVSRPPERPADRSFSALNRRSRSYLGAITLLGTQKIKITLTINKDWPKAHSVALCHPSRSVVTVSNRRWRLRCSAAKWLWLGDSQHSYTIAHSAIITLIGPEGGLVTRFSTNASVDQIASKLRKLIDMDGI